MTSTAEGRRVLGKDLVLADVPPWASKSDVGMAVGEACWLEKGKRGNEIGRSGRLLTGSLSPGSHGKAMID